MQGVAAVAATMLRSHVYGRRCGGNDDGSSGRVMLGGAVGTQASAAVTEVGFLSTGLAGCPTTQRLITLNFTQPAAYVIYRHGAPMLPVTSPIYPMAAD